MSSDAKQALLACYDYGMGGLWGIMFAHSEEEIADVYAELVVVHDRATWMREEDYARLTETPYDIDGAPRGMLDALLEDGERERVRLAIRRELMLYSNFHDNARESNARSAGPLRFASTDSTLGLFFDDPNRLLREGAPRGHSEKNLDLVFVGVDYLASPRLMRGLSVDRGTDQGRSAVAYAIGDGDQVYVLVSERRRHVVVAASSHVVENDGDVFDSPFRPAFKE